MRLIHNVKAYFVVSRDGKVLNGPHPTREVARWNRKSEYGEKIVQFKADKVVR